MAVSSTISGGLQTAFSMFQGNRNALSYAKPYFASNKDYQNHLINRNILSKAAQLVNDLEDARNAANTFQALMGENSPKTSRFSVDLQTTTITKTTTFIAARESFEALLKRGSVLDVKS